jgi:hypothetical protein
MNDVGWVLDVEISHENISISIGSSNTDEKLNSEPCIRMNFFFSK